jgi:tetratricopeptide (TPR) repeat protein
MAKAADARRSAAPPAQPLSPGRRRLFLAVTLALPWLLLLLLELGLRLGGYGGSYPLFVPYPDAPGYLFPNEQLARRYFRGNTFVPSPRLDFFHAEKPPGSFRVVFQGESSAAGFPYGHGGAPSRMLEARLQETFPDREIEVINTALTAISSYTLLDQADEIIAQHPDAVLIYTGHNEYYGALGAASTRSLGGSRGLVKAYLALRRLRTVQLLDDAIGALRGAAASNAADAGAGKGGDVGGAPTTVMELMAGEQRVPAGSSRYEQGLAQFRGNVGELLERYRSHGIPVLIGTIVSNERDQPPFVNGRAPGDTTSAETHYARARALERGGDTARAGADYRAAKELDELRFRAPEAINRIIREEAARHGATVVESEAAIDSASPGHIPGRTLILEHLHPNVDGYFLIADAFYAALRAKGMIGPWTSAVPADRARREIPVTSVDSMIGLLRTDRLTSGWPFRPRGAAATPVVDTLHPRTIVELLAQGVVRNTISWPEAMDRLREEYERAGEPDRAIAVARAMAQEYRYTPQPYMDASRIALQAHRYDEGLRYARLANARRESANSAQLVGLLLLRQGDQPAALPYLQRAAQLDPTNHGRFVAAQAAQYHPDLERRSAAAPRDTVTLLELASAYAITQQYEKARTTIAALQKVSPRNEGAANLLRRIPQ